jgi:hypothetical protein
MLQISNRSRSVEGNFYDVATIVLVTFFAQKMLNSLSLAIRDYAACIIAESVRLKIVDALLRLLLNTF